MEDFVDKYFGPRLSKDEQLAYFDEHREEAWRNVLSYIGRQKEVILGMSRARLVENFGEYGDRSWHLPPTDLYREVMEELADAPAWETMRIYAEEHSPGGRVRSHYIVQRVPDSPDD